VHVIEVRDVLELDAGHTGTRQLDISDGWDGPKDYKL